MTLPDASIVVRKKNMFPVRFHFLAHLSTPKKRWFSIENFHVIVTIQGVFDKKGDGISAPIGHQHGRSSSKIIDHQQPTCGISPTKMVDLTIN